MKTRIALSFALVAGLAFGQAQPKPKSRKNWKRSRRSSTRRTPTPASRRRDNLLTNFADTEFKAIALQVAAASAQQKNDFEKMVVYAERTLEADPKNYPRNVDVGATASLSGPASSISTKKRSSAERKSTRTRQSN